MKTSSPTPLIPCFVPGKEHLFMKVNDVVYSREAEIEGVKFMTAPLAFDKTVDLIGLALQEQLLAAGVQDQTDVVDSKASVVAIYFVKDGEPVIKAELLAVGEYQSKHAANSNGRLLLQDLVSFKYCTEDGGELVIQVNLGGRIETETGRTKVWTDGKVMVVVKTTTAQCHENTLTGYAAAGYDLATSLVNHNRRGE